ncbi:MAG: hypothetical protein JXQ71_00515 [Verrucomicrobia bacterium]|nr:hypothetical protein [Verrucomicrobiota bacterium]
MNVPVAVRILGVLVWGCVPLGGQGFELGVQLDQGRPRLSWAGQGPAKVYTLQHRSGLESFRWVPLFPWDHWPIADTSFLDTLGAEPARFYRLAVTERGRVSGVQAQDSATRDMVDWLIGLAEASYGIDIPFGASYAVNTYRIDYETLDGLLGPTAASGALFVPVGMAGPADLFSYQHGTVHRREDAPSGESSEERLIGIVAASHGYAVAMPDYVGLGLGSTNVHPYVHRRSSATAVVDMLRAVRASVATNVLIGQDMPHGLSSRLFLFGYSQGAYVTLAAQEEMERKHAAEFSITASAPSDGPYDLSGTMAAVMTAPRAYPSPNYVPYVLFTYNTIYRLFEDPAEILVEPYASTLPPLFDGQHAGGEIDDAMPASGVPRDILQPSFLEAFTSDPDHPFRAVLRENDVLDWAPRAPTRLYHCAADDVVPYTNAVAAYTSFVAAGADTNRVRLIDPDPAGTHGTCIFSAMPWILDWFDSLRAP